jgi:hypothetical protein
MEDLEMRTHFDFAPYRRSTVGFDRLFNLLEAGARDEDGYPPFDILKDGDNSYRITLAVASFRPEDIEVVTQQNLLTVTGKRAEDNGQGEYLHRGIAARVRGAFPARRFHRGRQCQLRERPAEHCAQARRARGDEAPQDRDRRHLGHLGSPI